MPPMQLSRLIGVVHNPLIIESLRRDKLEAVASVGELNARESEFQAYSTVASCGNRELGTDGKLDVDSVSDPAAVAGAVDGTRQHCWKLSACVGVGGIDAVWL